MSIPFHGPPAKPTPRTAREGGPETPSAVAVLDAIPTPCLVMMPDLVIVDANRAYLGNVGRRREEPLGTHPAAEDEVAAGPYAGGVTMSRGHGSDSSWCRCLLGVTLLVVNDGRCQTTLQ